MKYIITESQRLLLFKHYRDSSSKYNLNEQDGNKIPQKLIFLYLDGLNWHTWDIGDGEFNVADGEYGEDVLKFRIQYSSTVPDHEFNVIYISDDLVTKISKLFSIPNLDSIKSIIGWFNKKYDKNLTMNDFEWMESNDSYDIENED
jgi:hypothetical protein